MKQDDACDTCDQKKLELLTKPDGGYEYRLGLYININYGEFVKTWYRNGELVSEESLLLE